MTLAFAMSKRKGGNGLTDVLILLGIMFFSLVTSSSSFLNLIVQQFTSLSNKFMLDFFHLSDVQNLRSVIFSFFFFCFFNLLFRI